MKKILGLLVFLVVMLCGCGEYVPIEIDHRPFVDNVTPKNKCRIFWTARTQYVSVNLNKNCWEKGSGHVHLACVYEKKNIQRAASDAMDLLAKRVVTRAGLKGIHSQCATSDGKEYCLSVLRITFRR